MMHCPNCNKEIKDTAKWCGHCGHKIKAQPSTPEPIVSEEIIEQEKPEPIIPASEVDVVEEISVVEEEVVPEPEPVAEEPIQEEVAPLPKPTKEKKEPVPPVQVETTQVEEKPVEPKEKKKLPGWVWGVVGLVLVGGIAVALFLFWPSNLPQPVTEVLPNARVVMEENFDGELTSDIRTFGSVNLVSGTTQIVGTGYFNAGLIVDGPFDKGDAILASFMIAPEFGEEWWLVDLYTEVDDKTGSIGFSEWYHPYTDIDGDGYDVEFVGSKTPPKADVWYYVLFAVTDHDEVLLRVWERDNPAKISRHTWRLDSELSDREWNASFFAHVGTMYLEEIKVLSFSTK